jgi:myosin heavy subunit
MATFEPGSYLLVPHPDECYVAGRVVKGFKPGDAGEVELLDGSFFDVSAEASKDAFPTDEKSLESYDNMIQLNNLNEPLILHNLRERFKRDKIYTNISSILVAVNPFKMLSIYTPEVLEKYKEGGWRNQPPHVYTIADQAYSSMLSENSNQAVVISGESGAGKTETMKLVLQFLAEVSNRSMSTAKKEGAVEKQESLE